MNVIIQNSEGSLLKIQSVCSSDPSLAGIQAVRYYLDRVLEIPFPAAYGFIYGTLSPDGDPEDAWVISEKKLLTGNYLPSEKLFLVGQIQMLDDGVSDPKKVYFLRERVTEPNQQLRDAELKLIIQKLSFILTHLKIYKMKRGSNNLLVNSRISLKSVELNPEWTSKVSGLKEILPYPELIGEI